MSNHMVTVAKRNCLLQGTNLGGDLTSRGVAAWFKSWLWEVGGGGCGLWKIATDNNTRTNQQLNMSARGQSLVRA